MSNMVLNGMVLPVSMNHPHIYMKHSIKSCPEFPYKSWKKPQIDDKAIRLVLFVDSDNKGRQMIFDSKAVVKEEEKSSRWKCRQPQKLSSVKEGKVANAASIPRHNYMPNKTGSDSKMLEEMMFGAVGVAYKGTTLKVHVIRSPPQLMLTKVFIPDKPKRMSSMDTPDERFSSVTDLIIPRSASVDSNSIIAHSVPMDVPSHPIKNYDLIDEDSGLASLTSSGSFQAPYPSPSSTASSCNSLGWDRRRIRGQSKSLEVFARRPSHDILTSSTEVTSPSRQRRKKMALGIMFGKLDEKNEDANRLFENFFFSHIALFEGRLEQLRLDVERAYYSGTAQLFLSGMIDAFETFKTNLFDLYTAPRLCEPVWLNMMCFSSYRYMLCERFLKEFVTLVTKLEGKNSNFFMSTVITAVLTHHLAWVPTVTPAGGTPSDTYLDKHSAKWVDTLAKTHPYNPLWAQLGDLYGAIGFPLKISRTVIVGRRAEIVKKMLYVMSYFIRCSDILETADMGTLETCLKGSPLLESPSPREKSSASETTPVNPNTLTWNLHEHTNPSTSLPSFLPMGVESLMSDSSRKSSDNSSMADPQDKCANLDSSILSSNKSAKQLCDSCENKRSSEDAQKEMKVGNSVFYMDSVICDCDNMENKTDISYTGGADLVKCELSGSPMCSMKRGNESLRLGLTLDLSSPLNESQQCDSKNVSDSSKMSQTCQLSVAKIIENVVVQDVQHVRKCSDPLRTADFLPESSRTMNKEPGHSDSQSLSNPPVLSKDAMKEIFLKKGSDSMFNEYFDEGIETKTIDDVDEKDLVVDLPLHRASRNTDVNAGVNSDPNKAPSLPDLSASSNNNSRESTKSFRLRLGSLDQSYPSSRKPSISRQVSETGGRKNAPGRCRPVTPTELGKRRHISSTSSVDCDFMDPRAYCRELPMPSVDVSSNCDSQKNFDRNFGRSLLADFSDHYLSDFVLHGTSEKNFHEKMERDLHMATHHSVLDEPIAEAVCIVADTDTCTVRVHSSQHMDEEPSPCVASHLIIELLESVISMSKLKMSPEFCVMHLEDRLQEIYFKSKMMAEFLKKNRNIEDLLAIFDFNRSDLPLLVAIAGTHTPNFPLVCLS